MNRTEKFVLLATLLLTVHVGGRAIAQEAEPIIATSPDVQTEIEEGLAAFNSGDVIGAMGHYRRAADAGSTEAMVRLAWILDQSEDNAGALRLYSEAADAGDPAGQFGLAELYANGEGVKRDVRYAVKLFEAAAANGHTRAMRVLASAYEEGGLGVVPSVEQAEYWRKKLAAEEQLEISERAR
ncbi:MAG: sel1 repeat family protein [Chromatiales bacterium]|jgi:TPR repeat protein|nr:MAG: sel1 repeat family protein [Chromatiales bacterium]